jgi:hypothetical protein
MDQLPEITRTLGRLFDEARLNAEDEEYEQNQRNGLSVSLGASIALTFSPM